MLPEDALKAVSALTSLHTRASQLASSLQEASSRRGITAWASKNQREVRDTDFDDSLRRGGLRLYNGDDPDNERLCVICQSAQSTITLVPCGHFCRKWIVNVELS